MIKNNMYLFIKIILLYCLLGGYPLMLLNCQNLIIDNTTFNTGQKLFFSPGIITSPDSCSKPVLVTGNANIEYKAVDYVCLGPGFGTALSSGCGAFHASTGSQPPECPTAIITADDVICGSSVLSAESSTNDSGTIVSYQWQFNGIKIQGATSMTYTASLSGVYTVSILNSYNCTVISNQFAIALPPSPVTFELIAYVSIGSDPVMLEAQPLGGNFSGPGVIANFFYPQTAGLGTFTITYTYIDTYDCSYSVDKQVTVIDGQVIQLVNGWSGISSYMIPANPSMQTIWTGVEENMQILLGMGGGIYWPAQNVNTIGDWNTYVGYKVKMNQAAILEMYGEPVSPPLVAFPAGSYFLPVLSPDGASTDMLANLGNDLLFAINIQEGSVYWPGGGIYTLSSLDPGVGYLIRLNNPATFDFSSSKSAPATKPAAAFVNTTPWNDVIKTGDAHIISVSVPAMNELEAGDVIGVFSNSGLCVGMNGIGGGIENVALIAYGDDYTTSSTDGLVTGETMTFKLYRPSTGQSAELEVTFDPKLNIGTFEPEGLSIITGLKLSSLGVNDISKAVFDIYPNPSHGVFNIVTNSKITIQVMNVQGQMISTLPIEGNSTLDLSAQPKGIYFISIETDNNMFFKKLVIN